MFIEFSGKFGTSYRWMVDQFCNYYDFDGFQWMNLSTRAKENNMVAHFWQDDYWVDNRKEHLIKNIFSRRNQFLGLRIKLISFFFCFLTIGILIEWKHKMRLQHDLIFCLNSHEPTLAGYNHSVGRIWPTDCIKEKRAEKRKSFYLKYNFTYEWFCGSENRIRL